MVYIVRSMRCDGLYLKRYWIIGSALTYTEWTSDLLRAAPFGLHDRDTLTLPAFGCWLRQPRGDQAQTTWESGHEADEVGS